MKKNSLLQCGEQVFRVLEICGSATFVIDCRKLTIPRWMEQGELSEYMDITEAELLDITGTVIPDLSSLDNQSKAVINERFTIISDVLPYVTDFHARNRMMEKSAQMHGITKQTVKNYLCLYLAYQTRAVLAPRPCLSDTTLSQDEKNMRWALNKYFYTQNKNSLQTTYTLLLKEKYCSASGELKPGYPSFNQFRYFYRKTKKLQNNYISRDGLSYYQRNHRPLLGSATDYASHVGVGMLDATVLDIYLVNESGSLTGRPILTICVDGYSSLIMGYMLSWEGGVYSLRGLLLNIIADKVEYCNKFGIHLNRDDWDCHMLPGKFVTDRGNEYVSCNFENVCELGITIENLPAYRAELKGVCEKAFDLLQNLYKPYMKGSGVVEPDFQQRGRHDYRKDACLTLSQFETILLHCIIYYNSKRVLANYPYTADMVQRSVRPYASEIFRYGKEQPEANLISVSAANLILCLLPRTDGKFTRFGLKANGVRYKNKNYTEKYLSGGSAVVAYNPDDVSTVWLLDHGSYIRFELIESRFSNLDLTDVEELKRGQKILVREELTANTRAKIELANHIQTIARSKKSGGNTSIKGIRDTRQEERKKNHRDYTEGLK